MNEGRALCVAMGTYYGLGALASAALGHWDAAGVAVVFAAVLWLVVWATRRRAA